jgi:predicted metal-binding membrane protein
MVLARSFVWLGYFALILMSWWVMFSMAMDMGRVPMNMVDLGPLVIMWVIMMGAMMGPTFVPTLRTYEDLITTADGTRAGSIGLVLGYFIAWIGFAIAIAYAQTLLIEWELVTKMGRSRSGLFSAALLIAAGLYQFTSLKDRCLAFCRSPMTQFLRDWRPGFAGGVRMGLHHGGFCVLCCWGLMVIGFVGGVMDLIWMGGAMILMTLEKLPDLGRFLTRPTGFALLLWGGYVLMQSVGLM